MNIIPVHYVTHTLYTVTYTVSINKCTQSHTIKHKSRNTIRDKYETPTCFGTGMPSLGRFFFKNKGVQVQRSNRLMFICSVGLPEDDTPVPKHVGDDTCHELHYMSCI